MCIVLATGITRNYVDRAAPYIETMDRHGLHFARRIVFTVGFVMPHNERLERLQYIEVPVNAVKADAGNHCLQYGAFLPYMPDLEGAKDPVIVFTDADARIQRTLSGSERSILANWQRGVVGLGYNAGSRDTLFHEAHRLDVRNGITMDMVTQTFQDTHLKVYNTGFLVARQSTFAVVKRATEAVWANTNALFSHRARIQFAICAGIHRSALNVWELPLSWHVHGHTGRLPYGTREDEDHEVYAGEEKVFFRHAWHC